MPHYIQDHNGISVASQLTTHPPLYVVLLFASASATATSHPLPSPMHIPFVFYTSRLIAPSRFTRARIARLRFRRHCGWLVHSVPPIRGVRLTSKFAREKKKKKIRLSPHFNNFSDILMSRCLNTFNRPDIFQSEKSPKAAILAGRSEIHLFAFRLKIPIEKLNVEEDERMCRCYCARATAAT